MAVMAEWQSKKWEVSAKKIIALEEFSTSYKLKKENNNDAAGKPATNVRGKELQTMFFNTVLSDSIGVDTRKEIESWASLVGASGPFLLAGQRFGPEKFMLTDVNLAEVILDDYGRIRTATLNLSFLEDAGEASKDKAKSNGSGSGAGAAKTSAAKVSSPGVAPASAATKTALGISPSASDKATKKTKNPQMTKAAKTGVKL